MYPILFSRVENHPSGAHVRTVPSVKKCGAVKNHRYDMYIPWPIQGKPFKTSTNQSVRSLQHSTEVVSRQATLFHTLPVAVRHIVIYCPQTFARNTRWGIHDTTTPPPPNKRDTPSKAAELSPPYVFTSRG